MLGKLLTLSRKPCKAANLVKTNLKWTKTSASCIITIRRRHANEGFGFNTVEMKYERE